MNALSIWMIYLHPSRVYNETTWSVQFSASYSAPCNAQCSTNVVFSVLFSVMFNANREYSISNVDSELNKRVKLLQIMSMVTNSKEGRSLSISLSSDRSKRRPASSVYQKVFHEVISLLSTTLSSNVAKVACTTPFFIIECLFVLN